MSLPLIRGRDGLPAIAEPTTADHDRLRARLAPYEIAIRDLWEAARVLHRAYDRAASYGANHEAGLAIRTAEAEYDRCKSILRILRPSPKARP